MAQVYRVTCNSKEAAVGNQVYLDAVVERRTGTGPDWTWVAVVNGHRTIVLGAAQIQAIFDGPGTNPQKRQAIQDLLKAEALAMGIDAADEAAGDLDTLFPPASWPIQVTIRQ